MKPLLVLVLVLAAVGGLMFAISKLPGGGSGEGVDLGPPKTDEAASAGGTSTGLEPLDPGGGRDVAPVEVAASDERAGLPGVGYPTRLIGRVQNAAGEPVSEAQVVLTKSTPADLMFVNTERDRSADRKVQSRDDGSFAFESVEPYDHYSLEVSHEGYSRAEVHEVAIGMEGEFEEPPIVLTSGATLQGIVRATDGGGIPGAVLYLDSMFFPTQGEPSPDRKTATTDQLGYYEFLNIAAGHRTLRVEADGFANALISGLNFRQEDPPVERDVTLDVAEQICGVVVGPGNEPVVGARILALSFSSANQQCQDTAETAEDGRFCIENLAPGKYTIAVKAAGYRSSQRPRLDAGDTNVVIQMEPQASVQGRAIDAESGKPVERFTAGLRHVFDGNEATSPTEIRMDFRHADGEFVLSDVPPGSYLVEASAPGYAPTYSESFRITQGQVVRGIVVRLTKGGIITGIVLSPSGEPARGAQIGTYANDWTGSEFDLALGAMLPSNATQRTVKTDRQGRFEINALKGERYQLRVRGANAVELIKKDVEVTDGQTNDLGTLELVAGGAVTGSVLDQAGQPVSGARLQLRIDVRTGEPPRFYRTKTNEAGVYAIRNVHPGNYVIFAQPPPSAGADFLGDLTSRSNQRSITVIDGQDHSVELKLGG